MSKKAFRIFIILQVVCCAITIVLTTSRIKKEELYISYNEVLVCIKEDKVSSIIAKENSLSVKIILSDGTKKMSRIPSIESLSQIIFQKNQDGSNIQFEIKPDKPKTIYLEILFILEMLFLCCCTLFLKFKKKQKCEEADEKECAIHESGHAIIGHIIAPEIEISGISIIPVEGSNGRVSFNKDMFESSTTQKKLQILYAGKVAAECVLHKKAFGCDNDLERATRYIYNDIVDDSLLIKLPEKKEFNKKLSFYQIKTMNNICKQEYQKVQKLVKENEKKIIELAEILLSKKQLSKEDFESFMA